MSAGSGSDTNKNMKQSYPITILAQGLNHPIQKPAPHTIVRHYLILDLIHNFNKISDYLIIDLTKNLNNIESNDIFRGPGTRGPRRLLAAFQLLAM